LKLQINWQGKKFKALVDSGVIRNYILLEMVKWLEMTCQQKEYLYLLNIILRDLINYRGGIINLEIGLVIIRIKGKEITMNFNILPLRNDKAVLGMP